MIFKDINIQEKLIEEKSIQLKLLNDVRELLLKNKLYDKEVRNRLHQKNKIANEQIIPIDEQDISSVFTIDEIKNICVRYRLRFLDTTYFKGEFPYEAISKIKLFEKKYNTTISKFKIIAPDKLFQLTDCNTDPLLFAQLSDSKYYLIHKWGNDLAWYRAILYLPIRSIFTYFFSVIFLSAIIAWTIPSSWMSLTFTNSINLRIWLTVHTTIALFFFFIFLGATLQKNFSEQNWKSKHFN